MLNFIKSPESWLDPCSDYPKSMLNFIKSPESWLDPFSLVSAYRRGDGFRGDGELVGVGKTEKDTDQKMEDVLSCRGSKIRTCGLLLPKQAP